MSTLMKPKMAIRYVRLLSKYQAGYNAEGDLLEIYESIQNKEGSTKANRWLFKQGMDMLPHYLVFQFRGLIDNFRNTLKMMHRNFKRQPGYNFINITGLAFGLASCIFILLFVLHETSYDKYHEHADHVYRVGLEVGTGSGSIKYAMNVPPASSVLKDRYPQVATAARVFYWYSTRVVKKNDQIFTENGFTFADSDIFKILTYHFIEGNPETALEEPGSLILPKRLVDKYFPDESALGKILLIDDRDMRITGVIEDAVQNTHLPFDIFVSMKDLRNPPWLEDWTWPGMYTYVKLMPNVDAAGLSLQIENLADPFIKGNPRAEGKTYTFSLQSIKDIYLNSDFTYEVNTGNPSILWIFTAIGLFILAIACFNYINLTTAQSANRAREVGLRKTMGASRRLLIGQFLGESLLMTMAASGCALSIVIFGLGYFSDLTGIHDALSLLLRYDMIMIFLGFIFGIGIISGIYPALLLSSYKPATIVKGKSLRGFKGILLRRVLVILQFSITIILLIGTFIIRRQVNFMKQKNPGLVTENRLILPVRGQAPMAENFESIKAAFLTHPSIKSATVSGSVPGQGMGSLRTSLLGDDDAMALMTFYSFVDADFISSYEIEVLAGRGFNMSVITDASEACLINESAVRAFGWTSPHDAIGRRLRTGLNDLEKQIIGVVGDYHYRSLHYQIEPLVLEIEPTIFGNITLVLSPDYSEDTIHFIEQTWKDLFPGRPLEHYFLSDSIQQLYVLDSNRLDLFNIFTMLGILISGMGLLGLASFMAVQRTKEIGIRKVMGATSHGIILLLAKDYLKWICISNVIAWPLVYWAAKQWLTTFAYRAPIRIDIFFLASIMTLLLASLAVVFHTTRAAMVNPTDSLKYE